MTETKVAPYYVDCYCDYCSQANWICTCGIMTCREHCVRCGAPEPPNRPPKSEAPQDVYEGDF